MRTRRYLASLLMLLLATTAVHAQFIKTIGIKAGAAISDIRVTDVVPINVAGHPHYPEYIQDNVVSPCVSVFVNLVNAEQFTLQTDFTYVRKGASRTFEIPVTTAEFPDGNGTVVKYTNEFSLQYLEFALAAQPKLPFGNVTFYAHVAPTVSYLLSSSNLASIGELNKFQLGYTLGLGADVGHAFDSNLFIEVRYAGDFRSFYKQTDARFWNRSWLFSVGTTL